MGTTVFNAQGSLKIPALGEISPQRIWALPLITLETIPYFQWISSMIKANSLITWPYAYIRNGIENYIYNMISTIVF